MSAAAYGLRLEKHLEDWISGTWIARDSKTLIELSRIVGESLSLVIERRKGVQSADRFRAHIEELCQALDKYEIENPLTEELRPKNPTKSEDCVFTQNGVSYDLPGPYRARCLPKSFYELISGKVELIGGWSHDLATEDDWIDIREGYLDYLDPRLLDEIKAINPEDLQIQVEQNNEHPRGMPREHAAKKEQDFGSETVDPSSRSERAHKPDGWTQSELVRYVNFSDKTFTRIRDAAGLPPSLAGGEGQQRRYLHADVRAMIRALAQSSGTQWARNTVSGAQDWEELL